MRITNNQLKACAAVLAEALGTRLDLCRDCYGYHLMELNEHGRSTASPINVSGLSASAMYYYFCGIGNANRRAIRKN